MSKELFEDVAVSERSFVRFEDSAPLRTSPEWNDYVMGFFTPSELVDADTDHPKPLVSGLRRVAELLIGEIVSSGPTQVFPATESDSPGRATVVFAVQFANGHCFSDVADCWVGNTDDAFCVHPAAIASTKAEARALRKALRIKNVAAEEVTSKDTAEITRSTTRRKESKKDTDGEFKETSLMSAKQDSFIDTLCDRAGVDRNKFTISVFNVENDSQLSKKVASEMIDKLNGYINEEEKVPSEVML